jgi:PilZ domain
MQRIHGWIGRKDRLPVAIDAVVYRGDGSTVPLKLTDLTEEGCRLEGDEMLHIGERIQVSVPRLGMLEAQVRWAVEGSAGARFLADSDI